MRTWLASLLIRVARKLAPQLFKEEPNTPRSLMIRMTELRKEISAMSSKEITSRKGLEAVKELQQLEFNYKSMARIVYDEYQRASVSIKVQKALTKRGVQRVKQGADAFVVLNEENKKRLADSVAKVINEGTKADEFIYFANLPDGERSINIDLYFKKMNPNRVVGNYQKSNDQ